MNTYSGSNGRGIGDQLRHSREEAREVGSEVADIAADLRLLAAKEVELARAEVKEGVQAYGRGAGYGAAAAIFGWLTLLFACLGLMFGLDEVLPLWAAALITAAILLVVTAVLGLLARASIKSGSLVPTKALNSVQENLRWARAQLNLSAR
jgi:tetrahydromethanopterin S-methyltransferase subunit C